MHYWYTYLIFCSGILCYFVARLVYDDIVHGGEPKFGFNYKNPLAYLMVALCAIPIVNIATLLVLIANKVNDLIKRNA